MSKRITVYDCEKYDRTGNGTRSIHIPAKDNNEEFIKNIRYEQKIKNKIWRDNNPRKRCATPIGKPEEKESEEKINKSLNIEHKPELNLKLDSGTGNTTCILGSSKRGKSTLLMYLFEKYYNKKSFVNLLFSVNSHIKMYKKNNLIKFSKFDKDIIRDQLKIQKGTKNKYKFCNLFDDMITLKKEEINNLILTYRNSKISSIISMQYGFLLSKMIRANANNFILFGFNSDEAIEDVIKLFLRSWMRKRFKVSSLEDMINIYKEITDNHGFIYLHPQTDSVSIHRLKL
jgi:hypothetical protein